MEEGETYSGEAEGQKQRIFAVCPQPRGHTDKDLDPRANTLDSSDFFSPQRAFTLVPDVMATCLFAEMK